MAATAPSAPLVPRYPTPKPSEKGIHAIILVVCPDQRGVVACLSNFVYQNEGNIIDADYHTDYSAGMFLGRIEWDLDGFAIPRGEPLTKAVGELLSGYRDVRWEVRYTDVKTKIAIFCSKQDHCIMDLIFRHRNNELGACTISLVVSNHEDLRQLVESMGIRYECVPVTARTKEEAEKKQLDLCKGEGVELIVMAKYMQILSDSFLKTHPNVINIHHSFLPAFMGAKPYHQAHQRGVKLIGATSHFATADLDAGPIIEQEVVRISHRDTVEELVRKGKDLEKIVLARAVRAHINHRVLTYGNKTVVF
ncbi:phosphoribosylglycinamide formyltransferase [Gonapodya prolifera JEL478]|uniref:Phosphoribosylglycinamide formyltransferase n=1 Tax=Gonapodya prolifera (strain JEL478) TaxID=1344416 RepID=A0A139ANN3_GONPJ|nr:phosphoribosylglycinamide formyltransferase [Gonapodya prolifera JEL478]|eukprot:KXS18105.1 phosphoribosylglycinamide formyltransferase [Gonapodya prolifera JEL478]